MEWPTWVRKADRKLVAVGHGVAAAAREVRRQHEARHAWEGIPLGDCRTCGVGKLREATRRPLGGQAVVAGYLARFAAVVSALSAIPVALLGAVGHPIMLPLIMAMAWGLTAPLWILGTWCTVRQPGISCDHCRAWTETG